MQRVQDLIKLMDVNWRGSEGSEDTALIKASAAGIYLFQYLFVEFLFLNNAIMSARMMFLLI